MCVDYTNLNKACPKYSYMLTSIVKLVDNLFVYNQPPMYDLDREEMAFMVEQANYQYNMVHFGLKNAQATYQRMINKVFKEQIGGTLNLYMEQMTVKSNEEGLHDQHLAYVLRRVQQYNMRINLEKCTFEVITKKFWGFYLMKRGIQDNPNKCEAVIHMKAPKTNKEVMKLNRMLTTLNRFILKSA